MAVRRRVTAVLNGGFSSGFWMIFFAIGMSFFAKDLSFLPKNRIFFAIP